MQSFSRRGVVAVISPSSLKVDEDNLIIDSTNNTASLLGRVFRYGPILAWAVVIFIGSSDLLSAAHTSGFVIRSLRMVFPGATLATLETINFALRKLGHFTEYAILALLTARALRSSSRQLLRRRWFWIALALVVVYALFDEFRQSFVPSRTASIFDSGIDTLGGLTALVMILVTRPRQ